MKKLDLTLPAECGDILRQVVGRSLRKDESRRTVVRRLLADANSVFVPPPPSLKSMQRYRFAAPLSAALLARLKKRAGLLGISTQHYANGVVYAGLVRLNDQSREQVTSEQPSRQEAEPAPPPNSPAKRTVPLMVGFPSTFDALFDTLLEQIPGVTRSDVICHVLSRDAMFTPVPWAKRGAGRYRIVGYLEPAAFESLRARAKRAKRKLTTHAAGLVYARLLEAQAELAQGLLPTLCKELAQAKNKTCKPKLALTPATASAPAAEDAALQTQADLLAIRAVVMAIETKLDSLLARLG